MEVLFIFVVCFSTLVFLVLLFKLVGGKKSNLPPSPYKLPLLGNVHNLICSKPHRRLRDLAQKYGALMQLQMGEIETIVVSSPEIAKTIMKTHDLIFSNRPFLLSANIMSYGASNIVNSDYGAYWRQLRKICVMELLNPKRVESFQPIREEAVDRLVRMLCSNISAPLNLSKMIFSMIYSVTFRAALGSESRDQEAFILIVSELVQLASGLSIADMYPSVKFLVAFSGFRSKLERLFQKSDRILQSILDEHKRKRRFKLASQTEQMEGEDLVDVLLRFRHKGDLEFRLTDDNIKAVILDVLAAGSETSCTAVEWALSELLRNPEHMSRVQSEVRQAFDAKGKVEEAGIRELKFLKCVVIETLRLHPPAPLLIPRECSEDTVVNGYQVKAKTKVIVNAWAIQRHPDYWDQPEKFKPERFLERSVDFKGTDFSFIPFGSGRRVCPGILFAMPHIDLALAKLLYHFDWKLVNGQKAEDLDMTDGFGATVRRKNDLILIPLPRRPLEVV